MDKKVYDKFSHGGELKDKNNNIKYDFSVNINPFGLPDGVRQALASSAQAFTDYPDPECALLRSALAEKEGVSADQIVCGNGASDIIYRICEALDIKHALIPVPAFSEYERALSLNGAEAEYIYTKAEDGFVLTADSFEKWMSERSTAMFKNEHCGARTIGAEAAERYRLPDAVFLCSPTNPSGKLIEPEQLSKVSEWCFRTGALLVVDECFLEFYEKRNDITAVNLLKNKNIRAYSENNEYQLPENDNGAATRRRSGSGGHSGIIVINAFTKIYSMAGLRLGYAVCSDAEMAYKIHECGSHWNVSGPAQAAGLAALKEHEYLKKSVEFIKKERRRVEEALADILTEKDDIFRIFHSDANYILFTAPAGLAEAMAAEGVAIRDCGNYVGLYEMEECFYRIAVRTEAEDNVMLDTMRRCLKCL